MTMLNYQAVLDRVYQHFVTEAQPPGSVEGHIVYHQHDDQGTYRPCAIGLFDSTQVLADTVFVNQQCPDIEDLFYAEYGLLCEIFGVERISKDDMIFLGGIQVAHDSAAQAFETLRERFRETLTESLNTLADHYRLRPVAL